MSSLSEIYFNYNKAIAQANRLDGIAKKMKNAANRDMQGILNDVSRAWKSDSAPQYVRKGEKVKGNIQTSSKNLEEIASTIRTIAKRVRGAELEAWRIANERKL